MERSKPTKTVKTIHVDVSKCNGCLSCEMCCSASHATPAYGSVNPASSRIAVLMDETRDVYLPIRAGDYAPAECNGRNAYLLDGVEYSECSFCPAPCPSRDRFMDPATGLPLKCDMCDGLHVDEPLCVQACHPGALSYEERQEEADGTDEVQRDEGEIGLEYLIDRYGRGNVLEALARMAGGRR